MNAIDPNLKVRKIVVCTPEGQKQTVTAHHQELTRVAALSYEILERCQVLLDDIALNIRIGKTERMPPFLTTQVSGALAVACNGELYGSEHLHKLLVELNKWKTNV